MFTMAKCREIDALLKELRRQGFCTDRCKGSGHYKIRINNTVIATLPATPGGGPTVIKQIIRREHKKLVAAGFRGEFRW